MGGHYNKLFQCELFCDTYITAWNTMPPQRPSVLATFLGKITRNLSIDKWWTRGAYKRGGGQVVLALAGNQIRCYYRYENGAGVMVDYLRYDQQKDPDNPWFRSIDASGQDISLGTITQEKFDSYRQMYQPIALDLKPLLEFPRT